MAKYWVTELQGEVVDKCLQFHGGAGFINDYPIARMYRDSRITRIFGGSNEVMKMVMARGMCSFWRARLRGPVLGALRSFQDRAPAGGRSALRSLMRPF